MLLVCVLPIQSAHETAGASCARHSPRPLWRGNQMQHLGRMARRGRKRVFSRHCERSEAIHSFFARQDGLLRFARNDGRGNGLRRGACHRARIRATRWRAMTGEGVACRLSPSSVIASAAKQSILSLRGAMDCFAALAMTAGQDGLLRLARNDGGHGEKSDRSPLPLCNTRGSSASRSRYSASYQPDG